MHSLGILQWNSTRRDHPGNPGGVSGSGPVSLYFYGIQKMILNFDLKFLVVDLMSRSWMWSK